MSKNTVFGVILGLLVILAIVFAVKRTFSKPGVARTTVLQNKTSVYDLDDDKVVIMPQAYVTEGAPMKGDAYVNPENGHRIAKAFTCESCGKQAYEPAIPANASAKTVYDILSNFKCPKCGESPGIPLPIAPGATEGATSQ